jgi:hypothetical protein
MKTFLVVANQTLAGQKLFETIKRKHDDAGGAARFVLCVPRNRPQFGNVIYDDMVHDAAQVRIDLARKFLRQFHIEVVGEVGDPDPYSATLDAFREHSPDEIIISTLPATSSGWMRRDLIERVSDATRVPVTHVEVDPTVERYPVDVTLVVANRTAAGDELLEHLKTKAHQDRQRLFICLVPPEGGDGAAVRQARSRLAQELDRLRAADLTAAGMIGDPDPYTAVMNALQFFTITDVVISTLPATRSGWLRADLIERVKNASNKPVEHVESGGAAAEAA